MNKTSILFALALLGVSAPHAAAADAPVFSIAYLFAPGGSVTPLAPTYILQFPQTRVSDSVPATIIISNTGTAVGTITSLTLAGAGFTISGRPTLPLSL